MIIYNITFAVDPLTHFYSSLFVVWNIVQILIVITFAIVLISVFWSAVQVMVGGKSGDDVKGTLIKAVVAFFVAASIWGIIAFLGSALGIDDEQRARPPHVGEVCC